MGSHCSHNLVPTVQEVMEETMLHHPETTEEFCRRFREAATKIRKEKKEKQEKQKEENERMTLKLRQLKQKLCDMFKKLVPASGNICLMAVLSILI